MPKGHIQFCYHLVSVVRRNCFLICHAKLGKIQIVRDGKKFSIALHSSLPL
jgi:hypothetical protein